MIKPSFCISSCPFARHSTGYVSDHVPEKPLIAIVLRTPSKDDLVTGCPMSSKSGRYWWHEFMDPLGLTRDDVLISLVLHCFPNAGEFPIGKERKESVAACRHWDAGLRKFDPNVWGVTFNPLYLQRTPSLGKFIRNAMTRAKEYALEGYRPALLLGDEAKDTYAPWLDGALKKWQGHWWEKKL